MRDIIKGVSGRLAAASLMVAALGAASCQQTVNYGLPSSEPAEASFQESGIAEKSGPASGVVLGTGPTRIAMLLPLSAPGNGAIDVGSP